MDIIDAVDAVDMLESAMVSLLSFPWPASALANYSFY